MSLSLGRPPDVRDRKGRSPDNPVWATLSADNHADFETHARTAQGNAGERKVIVSVRNNGPGQLEPDNAVDLRFTAPRGATVVKAPQEAIDLGAYEDLCKSRGRHFSCPLDFPPVGKSTSVSFELRLNRTSTARATVHDAHDEFSRRDDRPGNDTARVAIEPGGDTLGLPMSSVEFATAVAVVALGGWGGVVWLRRRRRAAPGS